MDEAARPPGCSAADGIILTTDADSTVSSTWFADNVRHLGRWSRLRCRIYRRRTARNCQSRTGHFFPADGLKTPTRSDCRNLCPLRSAPARPLAQPPGLLRCKSCRQASAYCAVGGLPPKALGEDIAFTDLLDRNGFKVRHALDVSVSTSCRLDGRASGGAADTMRHRRDVPDAACDDELEPARQTLRKALMRGHLRDAWQQRELGRALAAACCVPTPLAAWQGSFNDVWDQVCRHYPALRRGQLLRPSNLPRQIATARLILRRLRVRPLLQSLQPVHVIVQDRTMRQSRADRLRE